MGPRKSVTGWVERERRNTEAETPSLFTAGRSPVPARTRIHRLLEGPSFCSNLGGCSGSSASRGATLLLSSVPDLPTLITLDVSISPVILGAVSSHVKLLLSHHDVHGKHCGGDEDSVIALWRTYVLP